jgi:hypothetical protein
MNAGRTVAKKGIAPPRTIWAYAYQIVPPQTRSRLRAVRALLDQEHATGNNGNRTWAGRLIVGAKATRILIVSDSLEHSADVNQKLEAELNLLQATFTVSEPVQLPGDAP